MTQNRGATTAVGRGPPHDAPRVTALVAEIGGERLGLATYRGDGTETELVTHNAPVSGRGIGAALMEAVTRAAIGRGCRRLWLTTSNNNLDAIGFYQSRGLRLVAVHRGAVDESWQL